MTVRELLKLYRQGYSVTQLAKMSALSRNQVTNTLKRNKVTIKKAGFYNRLVSKKQLERYCEFHQVESREELARFFEVSLSTIYKTLNRQR